MQSTNPEYGLSYCVTSLSLSFLIFTNRQCALVALEDVMTYLNEEGGQIAVRIYLFTVLQLLTFVVFICFTFLFIGVCIV